MGSKKYSAKGVRITHLKVGKQQDDKHANKAPQHREFAFLLENNASQKSEKEQIKMLPKKLRNLLHATEELKNASKRSNQKQREAKKLQKKLKQEGADDETIFTEVAKLKIQKQKADKEPIVEAQVEDAPVAKNASQSENNNNKNNSNIEQVPAKKSREEKEKEKQIKQKLGEVSDKFAELKGKKLKKKLHWDLKKEKAKVKEMQKKLKKLSNNKRKRTEEELEKAAKKQKKIEKGDDDLDDEEDDLEIDNDAEIDFAHLKDEVKFGEQAYQPPRLQEAKAKVKKRYDNMLKRRNPATAQEILQEVDEQRTQRNLDMEREKVLQRYRDKKAVRQNNYEKLSAQENKSNAQWQAFAAAKSSK